MMNPNPAYTCITCLVAFFDSAKQREHYKTDWHRYNLKRKVSSIPAVTAEEFNLKVLQQREEDSNNKISVHCKTCRKTFNSENAYSCHTQSKRHKDNVLHNPIEESDVCQDSKQHTTPQNVMMNEDSDVEEIDSDEWDDDIIINVKECLFCSHHSAGMIKNLKHMTLEHSFFIPDTEYLMNLHGLLTYLEEKVYIGLRCLWCNEKGRSFKSVEAVQGHMRDKGHCMLLHEGEALAEYADFYDYSSSYPNPEEEVAIPALDDSGYQLTLPSGLTIGHRSMMIYYKQSFDPNKVQTQKKKLHKVLAHYRSLGWTEANKEVVARKARDIQYMKKVQAKLYTKLGVKANKFQKHYRPQVIF